MADRCIKRRAYKHAEGEQQLRGGDVRHDCSDPTSSSAMGSERDTDTISSVIPAKAGIPLSLRGPS